MTAMVIQQFHQQSRMWHAAVDDVDAALEARIGELDAAWLDASMETRIPWGVRTRRDMIAFFAHHEAYHLGQMGSLRSMLGLPALMMKLAGL